MSILDSMPLPNPAPLDKSAYLPFYAARELGRINLRELQPQTESEAFASLRQGCMPNHAGLYQAPEGGLASLDLVRIEYVGEDDDLMLVLPGDKSDVTPSGRIRAMADILTSLPERRLQPYGQSVMVPRPTNWAAEVPAGRSTFDSVGGVYAHRAQPQYEVVPNAGMPQYRITEIHESGIIVAERTE